MKTLTELRQKWKPILEVKQSIPKEDIEEYNNDVTDFKRHNPNWQDANVLYI